MAQYRIPRESNLCYLPLVYFLPEDKITKCPTLRVIPRNLLEIQQSEKMIELILSDNFLNEVIDMTAALVFPHFGFGGWKEHYTGYCPVWKLSYALQLWTRLLEEETGWGLQALFNLPRHEKIPFFNPDYIKEVMCRIVKRGIAENNLQPILDAVRTMPCEEDFERWDTNVRKSFIRKWYHTRSKKIKTVSLEECRENEELGTNEFEDTASRFEENVEAKDFVNRLKARLTQKDMEILELRVKGHTYEEIAVKLGYKNHSGVVKRIQTITKEFIEYKKEQK